jgi:hypothetical protein
VAIFRFPPPLPPSEKSISMEIFLWSSNIIPHNLVHSLCGLAVRVPGYRFQALPDFLKISGFGTGSTQPREYSRGATWKKK